MIGLSLKKRVLIFISCIVCVLFAICIIIILPTLKKIHQLQQDIDRIEVELEQKYMNSQKLKRTLQELDNVKHGVEKLSQISVKAGDELRIITELENLATKYQINQTLNVSFQGQPNVKNPLQSYYSLSFLNNGSFVNHLNYLQDIEHMPYYVIVKSVKFEKRKTAEESPITVSFNALIYATPAP